jgi:putative FmdB family regulatory protein
MPTYEYEWKNCGHKFENYQGITEAPVQECPQCRGQVNRLVSGGGGFILKGNNAAGSGYHGGACSLEETGQTCCGRQERCETPGCEK